MNTDMARRQMVEQQIRAWDVFDASILELLKDLPREQFVPAHFQSTAFADAELPIGHGQSMMTPTVEGRVLQALTPQQTDDVLEIGTGSGFLTACLARLSNSVTSIDIYDDFLSSAAGKLEDTGIANVDLQLMDATQQLPEGQFDVIAITGSIAQFDPRYVAILKPGGRLFVVVGEAPVMDACLVTPAENGWTVDTVFETELAPLVNANLPPRFLF
jgi:protein-L-isoaspartate(D-aspartate) O-methyltransferase